MLIVYLFLLRQARQYKIFLFYSFYEEIRGCVDIQGLESMERSKRVNASSKQTIQKKNVSEISRNFSLYTTQMLALEHKSAVGFVF